MLVSVIVPVFNSALYLRHCIEGLLDQDVDPASYEILMVDNNSTDASASIVADYPEVRLLREPKQGAYAARNRGLRAARGDVVAFTDADCVPQKTWLRECLAGLRSPAVQIVVGHAAYDARSWLMEDLGDFELAKETYVFSSEDPALYYGRTNNMAARRDVLDKIGEFAEGMRGGDTIFVQRAVARFSPAVVAFRPSMRVRHLEMQSVWHHYRKLFAYGRSQQFYRRVVSARPLTFRERIGVVNNLRADHSLFRYGALLVALAAGVVPWSLGSASALAWRQR